MKNFIIQVLKNTKNVLYNHYQTHSKTRKLLIYSQSIILWIHGSIIDLHRGEEKRKWANSEEG